MKNFGSAVCHGWPFSFVLWTDLVKLPLGSPLPGGEIPCLVVGEILRSHPQLQILDLRYRSGTQKGTKMDFLIKTMPWWTALVKLPILLCSSDCLFHIPWSARKGSLPCCTLLEDNHQWTATKERTLFNSAWFHQFGFISRGEKLPFASYSESCRW